MWIKICANTNLDDALQAFEAGADAVGFVFAPSPRQVTPAAVAGISARLPASGLERVGVFVAQTGQAAAAVDEIRGAAETAGLTAVQLHGTLDLRFAELLREALGPKFRLIHTLHWRVEDDAAAAAQVEHTLRQAVGLPAGERILLDAKVGHSSGGLGVSYDWELAARVLRGAPSLPVIVAGGLRPETVGEAVRILRPYGVDVASGVECAPGRKDHGKVVEFIRNARLA